MRFDLEVNDLGRLDLTKYPQWAHLLRFVHNSIHYDSFTNGFKCDLTDPIPVVQEQFDQK